MLHCLKSRREQCDTIVTSSEAIPTHGALNSGTSVESRFNEVPKD